MIRTYWLPAKFWYPHWLGVHGHVPKRGPRKGRLFRWGVRILWLEVYSTTPEFDAKERKASCSRAYL